MLKTWLRPAEIWSKILKVTDLSETLPQYYADVPAQEPSTPSCAAGPYVVRLRHYLQARTAYDGRQAGCRRRAFWQEHALGPATPHRRARRSSVARFVVPMSGARDGLQSALSRNGNNSTRLTGF